MLEMRPSTFALAEQGAVPFRELWMLAAAKDGAPSWRLARQQALL